MSPNSSRQVSSNFKNPLLEWRRVSAELWGTFLLTVCAAGIQVVDHHYAARLDPAWPMMIPGLMVMTIICLMGKVSGAHVNPAVTLAFALRRDFPWARVPGYLAAQFSGAALAGFFLFSLWGPEIQTGATVPHPASSPAVSFFIETLLTTGLVNTVLGTAFEGRNQEIISALGVGGYITVAGLWAGPVSGASMNPARSLGIEVPLGQWADSWIYIAGPLTGALLGVTLEWILKGAPSTAGRKNSQGR